MAKSIPEIIDQMASHGIHVPPGIEIEPDNQDNWKRFKPDQNGSRFKKNKEAYYGIWTHQLSNGQTYYFGVFGIGDEQYLIEHNRLSFNFTEWEEVQKRQAEDKKIIEAAIAKKRAECKAKAKSMWKAATDSVSMDHPYIKAKKIKPYGARQLKNQILVPMSKLDVIDDQDGISTGKCAWLASLQSIFETTEDGQTFIKKVFLSGTPKKGSFCFLGKLPDSGIVYFCEGWATGCSIHEATNAPTVVCFDAGNIDSVLDAFEDQFPKIQPIIAADNDYHYSAKLKDEVKEKYKIDLEIKASGGGDPQRVATADGVVEIKAFWRKKDGVQYIQYSEKLPGQSKAITRLMCNVGVAKAEAAAYKHRCRVIIPKFQSNEQRGTDWNDLACEEGLDVVRAQLTAKQPEALNKGGNDFKKTEKSSSQSWHTIENISKRYIVIENTDTAWDTQYHRITKFSNLRNLYGTKLVNDWLKDDFGNRRLIQPEQLIFEPDPKKVPTGSVSMFSGWPLKPKAGDCQLIINHLHNICGRDDDLFHWLERWLAFPLQHPGAKMHTAVIVHGIQEGTGKSMFFNMVSKIYGQYACSVNQAMMQSDFNGWVSQKLFVVCEEVVSRQDRNTLKGVLKNMVTNECHTINEKGLPARFEVNKTNFVFLSNELQPAILDPRDRRYLVIRFEEKNPPEYFKKLANQIANGGTEAFYQYLLSVDTSDFDESERPYETQAWQDLKRLGTDNATNFINDWLDHLIDVPVGPALATDLYELYKVWCKTNGERNPLPANQFYPRCKTLLHGERLRVSVIADIGVNEIVQEYKTVQKWVYWPPDCENLPIAGSKNPMFDVAVRDFQLATQKAKTGYYRDFKPLS